MNEKKINEKKEVRTETTKPVNTISLGKYKLDQFRNVSIKPDGSESVWFAWRASIKYNEKSGLEKYKSLTMSRTELKEFRSFLDWAIAQPQEVMVQ